MTIEDTIRTVVREEIRAAVRELAEELRGATAPAGHLLSYAEAAVYTGFGTSTIQDMVRSGRLNKYGEGRRVRVSREELDRIMAPKPRAVPSEADLDARAERLAKGGH